MRLFGLKNCDTCRKALKALEAAGREVTFVDVRADGISEQDLARFHDAFGANLVNTRSTTWRGLTAEEREGDPLQLLRDHPALMKRPVIEDGPLRTLGWTRDAQETWI